MQSKLSKSSKTWTQAKKDGFEQISAIFDETSHNEKEHAKIWYKLMHDGKVDGTSKNLELAAAGENYEWTDMYKHFAEEARAEGYDDIAEKFEQVAAIEKEHEHRYLTLKEKVDQDIVFKSDKVTVWKCRNCGYIHVGETAPETCPVCAHPKAFFEVRAENY